YFWAAGPPLSGAQPAWTRAACSSGKVSRRIRPVILDLNALSSPCFSVFAHFTHFTTENRWRTERTNPPPASSHPKDREGGPDRPDAVDAHYFSRRDHARVEAERACGTRGDKRQAWFRPPGARMQPRAPGGRCRGRQRIGIGSVSPGSAVPGA